MPCTYHKIYILDPKILSKDFKSLTNRVQSIFESWRGQLLSKRGKSVILLGKNIIMNFVLISYVYSTIIVDVVLLWEKIISHLFMSGGSDTHCLYNIFFPFPIVRFSWIF
jgi:hypothetical protein